MSYTASALVARRCVLALLFVLATSVQASPFSLQSLGINERVFIYHDPELTRPRAEITVPAGSFHEPAAVPGLAHLVEHLILRAGVPVDADATDVSDRSLSRLTSPGISLRSWLQRQGSQPDATTSYDRTRFSFDVELGQLAPALRQWRYVLTHLDVTAPVLTSEVAVVDAEFRLHEQQQRWRERDILTSQAAPSHPWRRWHPGNGDTLDLNAGELGAAVQRFHQQFYRHSDAYLIVAGPQSVDELAELVRSSWKPQFGVESTHREAGKRILAQTRQVELQTARQRELTLLYLPPETEADARISRLGQRLLVQTLSRRESGSLFELLRQTGWVSDLKAGPGMSLAESDSFQISVALTPLGWQRKQQVIESIERYLLHLAQTVPTGQLLRAWAVAAATNWQDEIMALSADERFDRLANLWASGAHLQVPLTPAQQETVGPWLRTWVSALASHRLAVFMDASVAGQARTPVFDTRFRVLSHRQLPAERSLDVLALESWSMQQRQPLIRAANGLHEPVVLAADSAPIWLWPQPSQQPVTTGQVGAGQVSAQLALAPRAPTGFESSDAVRALQLSVLATRLTDRLPGLGVEWKLRTDQMELSLMGSATAVERGVELLASPGLMLAANSRELARAQQQVKQRWQITTKPADPFHGLYQTFFQTWQLPENRREEGRIDRIDMVNAITVDQLNQLASIWQQSGVVAALISGMDRERARPLENALQLLIEESPAQPSISQHRDGERTSDGRDGRVGEPILATSNSHQAFIWCQVSAARDVVEEAIMRVARPLLHQYFFDDLRSQQGVGYGVFVTDFSLGDRHVLSFNAESSTMDAGQLLLQTRRFLAEVGGWIHDISDIQLSAARNQAVARLNGELGEYDVQQQRVWRAVRQQSDVQVVKRQQMKLLDAMRTVSIDDLHRYLTKYWVAPEASVPLATGDSRSPITVKLQTIDNINALGG